MIDLIPIMKDHFNTFRSHATGKILWGELGFFCAAPTALGVVGAGLGWKLGGVDNILAAFAILAGLLFNLLVLLFDVTGKAAQGVGGATDQNERFKLAKEVQANVTYSLLVALTTAAILGVASGMDVEKVNRWVTSVLLILFTHFTLCLLMILRRIRSVYLNTFS